MIKSLKNNEDWGIRENLFAILGETKDPRAIKPLAEALGTSGVNISSKISKALLNFGDKGCDALIQVLEEGPSHIRNDAATALGRMGNKRAVGPLIKTLEYANLNMKSNPVGADWLRSDTAKALKMITKKDFGEDHEKWSQWWNKNK